MFAFKIKNVHIYFQAGAGESKNFYFYYTIYGTAGLYKIKVQATHNNASLRPWLRLPTHLTMTDVEEYQKFTAWNLEHAHLEKPAAFEARPETINFTY